MRLYLCVLLRLSPIITEAVATGVNGSRWFDIFVPEFGMECKIETEELTESGVLDCAWDVKTR
jgi:DIS3-like exonuclease 2